ncbi:MAG: hypothetical protein ABR498_01075 [Candidatus Dormibacteria bacterium]
MRTWTRAEAWVWRRRGGHVLLVVLAVGYVCAWVVTPLTMPYLPTDNDHFFWPAAQVGAAGHPLLLYTVHGQEAYPVANGPLGLLLLAPLAAISNALQLPDTANVHASLVSLLGAGFALLMTVEALRIVCAAREELAWPLAASTVMLLAPPLIIAVGDYGHAEQPLQLWLVLLSGRLLASRRSVAAGAAFALALLTRTTAVLYLIPAALLPLITRGMRSAAARMLLTTVLVTAAGIAPFIAADTSDVVHSLVTYRGALPIGGGSLWAIAEDAPIAGLVQHTDVLLVMLLAATLCALIVWRRRHVTSNAADLCALLAVTSLCFPMLAKTVFPYYLVEPYIFCAIWWLARPGSVVSWRAGVLVLLIGDTFVARWGASNLIGAAAVLEGVLSSLLLAIAAAAITVDCLRSVRTREADVISGRERPIRAREPAQVST